MRVMVMIKATKSSEAGAMPSEALLREMGAFNEALVKAGVMQAGEGLHPSSTGTRVRFSGGKKTVVDGPFAETKDVVAGFWIWKVSSMAEALEWVKRCPDPMPGEDAEIEVRPVFEAEGFGAELTPELRARAPSAWDSGDAYERYVGRWSRKVASEFLGWLDLAHGLAWVDVGSGTGALASTILTMCAPSSVVGIDASESFVAQARQRVRDPRARFEIGDATRLPLSATVCAVAVSGLVLNFVRDHASMVREMARVTRPRGTVAAYVWDYAGGMQMIRHFWEAVTAVNPHDARLDQAERFPVCRPEALRALFEGAGLTSVTVHAIDIPTEFRSFDDYWQPYLGKTGTAPAYLASLSDDVRERVRRHLEARLAPTRDAPIALTARAWAVRGIV